MGGAKKFFKRLGKSVGSAAKYVGKHAGRAAKSAGKETWGIVKQVGGELYKHKKKQFDKKIDARKQQAHGYIRKGAERVSKGIDSALSHV